MDLQPAADPYNVVCTVLQNVNILLEGTFSLEKRKSKWLTVR